MILKNNRLFLIHFILSGLFTIVAQEQMLVESIDFMHHLSPIHIGRFTYGYMNILLLWPYGETLRIGNFTSIGGNCAIYLSGNHHVDWVTTYPFGHIYQDHLGDYDIQDIKVGKGPVIIGNDVWIADSVTIMSGVTIGDGAVIANHSVVTKDVEPYAMVGGNPAKFIRYRFDQEVRTLLQKLRWWDLDIEQIKEIVPELCAQPDAQTIQTWIEKYRKEEL